MAKILATRGGQYPLTATFTLTVGDTVVNTSGADQRGDATGVYEVIKLPVGAVVQSGELVVETAFVDGGTPTLALGDAGSAARYLSATTLESAARTALTPTGYVSDGANLRATIATGNGDGTVGKFTLRVTYVINGRQNESQTA